MGPGLGETSPHTSCITYVCPSKVTRKSLNVTEETLAQTAITFLPHTSGNNQSSPASSLTVSTFSQESPIQRKQQTKPNTF